MDIVNRNGLIVVNSTNKCFGTITRLRRTTFSEEKSVIDYFIVCPEFFELISSLVIDEERKYVLTKYASRMGKKCVKPSDHNVLVCKLDIKWDRKIIASRKEIFQLKDVAGLEVFSQLTSNCPKLVQMSQNSSNFEEDTQKWLKQIENIKHQSFKKIRLTGKQKDQNPEVTALMKVKSDLISKLHNVGNPVQKSIIEDHFHSIEK